MGRTEPVWSRRSARRECPDGQILDLEADTFDRRRGPVTGACRSNYYEGGPRSEDPEDLAPDAFSGQHIPIRIEYAVWRVGDHRVERSVRHAGQNGQRIALLDPHLAAGDAWT
jgi:hypothetical protein